MDGPITINLTHDTFLKGQLLGADDLADSEKAFFREGEAIEAIKVTPSRNQHLKLHLLSPLGAMDGGSELGIVYAYDPHIQFEGDDSFGLIKLDVPYRCQLDNDTHLFGAGWRQCNLTSNVMLADFLLKGQLTEDAKAQGLKEPESLYGKVLHKYGDTIDHDAQTRALRTFGIESYFSHTLSEEDVLESLRLGIPVVCGFAYKSSGHICVIVGHDPERKGWLVHDPYGTRHGASDNYDVGVGGNFDFYSYATMQKIFWDMGNEAGWGRVVTSVRGKDTGLRADM